MASRFQIAKKDIINYFDSLDQKVFSFRELSKIQNDNKNFWRFTESYRTKNFIDDLIKYTLLIKHELSFPNNKYIRYTWGEVSLLKIILSINNNAYFSHYSAIYLHNLTEQIPKSIYINIEQSARGKNIKGELTQDGIDRTFSQKQRTTNNTATINDYTVYLLNGKNTNNLGVIEVDYKDNKKLRVTDIERTLIDATVRPVYSGGVSEVLKAFKNAAGSFSVNKLTAYLAKINYTYPYHQCIGFYLEKSGKYKQSQIDLLNKFEKNYDFYLTYKMGEMSYDSKWKIYFPKSL